MEMALCAFCIARGTRIALGACGVVGARSAWAAGIVGEEWLPLKLLAYREQAEHAAGVDEQDVLCANQCAALFKFVVNAVHCFAGIYRVQDYCFGAGYVFDELKFLRSADCVSQAYVFVNHLNFLAAKFCSGVLRQVCQSSV